MAPKDGNIAPKDGNTAPKDCNMAPKDGNMAPKDGICEGNIYTNINAFESENSNWYGRIRQLLKKNMKLKFAILASRLIWGCSMSLRQSTPLLPLADLPGDVVVGKEHFDWPH
jgi:hypothetical protein